MLDWRSQDIVLRFSFKPKDEEDTQDTQEQQQKQPLGVATMEESDNGKQEQRGKKRRHLAKTEQIRSDNCYSKRHDNTSDDDDEDP